MKFKFQKGDTVEYLPLREVAIVKRASHRINGKKWFNYEIELEDDGIRHYAKASDLTLVERNSMSQSTSGIAAKVRNVFRKSDDRLLIEAGVVTESGETTSSGRRVLSDILFEEYKAKIVERVTAVKEDEKPCSKKTRKSK